MVCSEVVEHLPITNHKDFFSELSRCLKHGAHFIISTPNRNDLKNRLKKHFRISMQKTFSRTEHAKKRHNQLKRTDQRMGRHMGHKYEFTAAELEKALQKVNIRTINRQGVTMCWYSTIIFVERFPLSLKLFLRLFHVVDRIINTWVNSYLITWQFILLARKK